MGGGGGSAREEEEGGEAKKAIEEIKEAKSNQIKGEEQNRLGDELIWDQT